MQISSLDFSSFKGRIAIGKIYRGDVEAGKDYYLMKKDGSMKKNRVKELYLFEGLGRAQVDAARSGDMCAIVGLEDF